MNVLYGLPVLIHPLIIAIENRFLSAREVPEI